MPSTTMLHKAGFLLSVCALMFPLSLSAHQEPLWQGSGVQQSTTPLPSQGTSPSPVSQDPVPSSVPQRVLPFAPQAPHEGHPQTREMPAAQPLPLPGDQPTPSPRQSTVEPPAPPLPPKPIFLGITGDTSPACRYPGGVRISRIIEGSPAHQAGLKGESTLSWKDAVVGILATSPVALFISPLLSSREHSRWGDLILAVDGKRIHNKEAFELEMKHFQPGDVVYFSVLRIGHGLKQVPVRLAEYPSASPIMREASLPSSVPGS